MAKKKNKRRIDTGGGGGFVFSTDPDFEPPLDDDAPEETPDPKGQDLRIHLERYKGNKKASVVRGFVGRDSDLANLGRKLKAACGTGGSVKNGEIMIQGDKREQIGKYLESQGYRYKLSGG